MKFLRQYKYPLIITLVFIVLASLAGIFRYTHYEAAGFDLGIFTQMIKNTINGVMSANGMPLYNNMEGLSHLAIHFSPILFVVIPFYMIWQSPITLLIVQAVLAGIGGLEIYYLANNVFKLSGKISTFVLLLFVANPIVWSLLVFDFHELAFAIPCVMMVIIGYFKKNWWLFGIGLFLSLLIKEDVTITIGLMGLVLLSLAWFKNKEHKINKPAIVMMSGAFVSVVTAVLISWKASNGLTPQVLNSVIVRYSINHSTLIGTIVWYARHMLDIYSVGQIFAYFAPLCFLPLICMESLEWIIPAFFVLGMAMISTWGGQHNFINQYGTTAIPWLFTAFIISLKQKKIDVQKSWKWIAAGCSIAIVIVFFFTKLTCINQLIAPNFNQTSIMAFKNLNKVVAEVPKGNDISITANNIIVSHFISSNDAYCAKLQFGTTYSTWGYPQTITDYVLTDTNKMIAQEYRLTVTSQELHNWDKETSQELEQDGRYQLVDSVNGVELWKLK